MRSGARAFACGYNTAYNVYRGAPRAPFDCVPPARGGYRGWVCRPCAGLRCDCGYCLATIGGAVSVAVYAADNCTKISGDLRNSGFPRRRRHQRSGGAVDPLSDAVQRINPTRSVVGYHPVPAVKPGQIVCKDGARTSRTCGPAPKVNPDTGGFATHLRPPDAGPGSPASASTFMRTS